MARLAVRDGWQALPVAVDPGQVRRPPGGCPDLEVLEGEARGGLEGADGVALARVAPGAAGVDGKRRRVERVASRERREDGKRQPARDQPERHDGGRARTAPPEPRAQRCDGELEPETVDPPPGARRGGAVEREDVDERAPTDRQ